MALPANFMDELRSRTPIASVIGRRVRLARSGRQWKGCCPFHGERTPSFTVYDDHFHCFGCGAHGDVFTWLMGAHPMTFPEAVTHLRGGAAGKPPVTAGKRPAIHAENRKLAQRIWCDAIDPRGTA